MIVEDDDKPGMKGMNVMQIQLFFSFQHLDEYYLCALVEWFSTIGQSPNLTTGMWRVKPDVRQHGCLQCLKCMYHNKLIFHEVVVATEEEIELEDMDLELAGGNGTIEDDFTWD